MFALFSPRLALRSVLLSARPRLLGSSRRITFLPPPIPHIAAAVLGTAYFRRFRRTGSSLRTEKVKLGDSTYFGTLFICFNLLPVRSNFILTSIKFIVLFTVTDYIITM